MNNEIVSNIKSVITNLRQSNTVFDDTVYRDLNTLIDTIDDYDCDLIKEHYDTVFNACIDDSTNKYLNNALQYMQLVISEFDSEIRFIDINEYL